MLPIFRGRSVLSCSRPCACCYQSGCQALRGMISLHCASTDMCAAPTLLIRLDSARHSVARSSRLEREGMRSRHPAAASARHTRASHRTLYLRSFTEHSPYSRRAQASAGRWHQLEGEMVLAVSVAQLDTSGCSG